MSSIALSGVPELHADPPTLSPGLRRLAILAAAALHLGVFLWLFHPWRAAQEHKSPDVMPVSLVFEPPPKPKEEPVPPTPKPAPIAAPAPPPVAFDRESGPDAKTTAPPLPDDSKTEEKPIAPAPPEPAPPTPEVALIVPPPSPGQGSVPDVAPPKPRAEPPHPSAAPKEEKPVRPPAPTHAEPRPLARLKNVAPGERETHGDPYLNAVRAEFEKHRFYPPLARPLGLTGTAHLGAVLDRAGNLLEVLLQSSSGAELLDRAAEKMVRDTRFPPPPADIPGDRIIVWMDVPMAP